MGNDAVELQQRIRFALGILGESNGHHEFEALCLGLARRRITSNLLPATGPVSAGGDQGRDGESHWTNIPQEMPGTSLFEALASTQRVVMACTTQTADVTTKIRTDLKSICGKGTPVDRVIYFTLTAVPVSKRHDLIEHADQKHHVELDIWDAVALTQHLADYDLFYLAVRYLHLPSDLTPQRPDSAGHLPDWYLESRERWRGRSEPALTLGDLVDLRAPLRHATFHDEARADVPEWIDCVRPLLDSGGGETALRARYEIVVATLRGLGDMRPTDRLARDFFIEVTTGDAVDLGVIEDAVVLLNYAFGALVRGLTELSAQELCYWQSQLVERVDRMLNAGPYANAKAHLLALRVRLALHPDMTAAPGAPDEGLPTIADITAAVVEAVESDGSLPVLQSSRRLSDLDAAMRTLVELGQHLDSAPMFPVERIADLFDYLTPLLVDHPLYPEARDLLDQATDRVTGQTARGHRAQSRGMTLIRSGRLPQALQEIHQAKADWLSGDTLEGGLNMLLLCARLYSELGLPVAAKQHALAAATMAKTAPIPELRHFVPRAIITAARYDHQAGNWISATHLYRIGIMAQDVYCDEPYNEERHPHVWEMMANQAITQRTATALRPAYLPLLREITATVGIDTVIDGILAPSADAPAATEEAYAEAADAQGVGRPFSDAGPTRRYTWSALGVDWEITCPNERPSVLAAERYAAALQVLLAELATQDPLFLPGRLSVEVRSDTDPAAGHPTRVQGPGNDANRWTLRLPPTDLANPEAHFLGLLNALLSVTVSQSLLSDEAFTSLIDRMFAGGLRHKLLTGRPYDELAGFLTVDDYLTMGALTDPPVGASLPRGRATADPLPARTGPGPGYEEDAALEAVTNRYAVMLPIVRYTLPRLTADPGFRHTATNLRQEGWLDWHLLTAIANAVGNHRLRLQGDSLLPGSSPEQRASALALFRAPERPEEPPAPAEAFTQDALRSYLTAAALSTAHGFGLVVRSNPLDPRALLAALGERYGYWTDDVEHVDPFTWPAETTTTPTAFP